MVRADKISLMQYYGQCFASFCRHYGKPKLRLTKKIIHQLRVDVKYMRAIFSLLKLLNKGTQIEVSQIKVINKLFQAAGMVREEQVNLTLLSQYKSYSSLSLFKSYLIRKKRSAYRTLHKTLAEFIQTYGRKGLKVNKNFADADYQTENISHAQNFIQKGIKRIKKLYPDLSPKNLHDIRKALKQLSYVTVYLKEIFPNNKYRQLPEKIKPIEILMGVWNNRTVFQNSIEQFLTKDESFPEVLRLKELIRTIKKQNKKSIRQLDKSLGKLFG